jgi:hypothetical protein
MKKVKVRRYTAHLDYDVVIDVELLNMKIRIYGEDFEKTGIVDYEGSIGKFIEERIPADTIVELLPGLKETDKIAYRFHGGINYIERIR